MKGEIKMNKQHIKGAGNRAKGAVKETAGKATGNESLELEGKIDRVKGKTQQAVGDAKDRLQGK